MRFSLFPLLLISTSIVQILGTSRAFARSGDGYQAPRLLRSHLEKARVGHRLVPLANQRVLVVGGAYSDLGSTGEIETFDPQTSTFRTWGERLHEARADASVTLLPDGSVLVAGGASDFSEALASAEILDPRSQKVRIAPDLTVSRGGHTATLLPDGRVLLVGGSDGNHVLDSAEIFDPADQSFRPIEARLLSPRANHTATLIGKDFVLIAGGETETTGAARSGAWKPLATAELYDIAYQRFIPVKNSMTESREFHQATRLHDGRVLLNGGIWEFARQSDSADIFDPSDLRFHPVVARMKHARSLHTATTLANGDVLICGGTARGEPQGSCETFVTEKSQFAASFAQALPRWQHQAIGLPSHAILFLGGMAYQRSARFNSAGPSNSAELSQPPQGMK